MVPIEKETKWQAFLNYSLAHINFASRGFRKLPLGLEGLKDHCNRQCRIFPYLIDWIKILLYSLQIFSRLKQYNTYPKVPKSVVGNPTSAELRAEANAVIK